jgi:hypothetical protein
VNFARAAQLAAEGAADSAMPENALAPSATTSSDECFFMRISPGACIG